MARWIHLAAVILVALASYLTYSNAAPNAVVHDDAFFFPYDRTYGWREVGRFFTEDTWAATGAPSGVYRPLLLTSIAADQSAHPNTPWAFHRTNIALHVIASVLVYLFLRALLLVHAAPTDTARSRAAVCAAVAAALFGVHPIHTEAVDSIFNRSEMLATIGVTAALWTLLRLAVERPILGWTVASVIYGATLLCRESAATIPFVAALMLLLVRFDGPLRTRLTRLAPILVMGLPLGLYVLLRHSALGSFLGAPSAGPSGSDTVADWGGRLVTTLTMMRESLRMIAWPHPLSTTYIEFDDSGLAMALAVHGIAAAAFAVAIRRRLDLVAFGLGAFYLTLLPSTRLFTAQAISVVVAERYVYLPSVFLAVLLAAGLMWAAERWRWSLAWPVAGGLALCAVLAPITYRRNAQWHSAEQLFEADFQATGSGDALRLLTGAYLKAAKYAQVAQLCDQHLEAHGDNPKLENHCATAYMQLQRFADAESAYKRALASGSIDSVAHANLGRLYGRQGRNQDGEREFSAAADAETEPARRHWRRGQGMLFFHPDEPARLADAQREIEEAVRLQPDSAEYARWLQQVKDARRRVTAATSPAPPSTPSTAGAATAASLSSRARAQLVERLSGAAPGTPAWIVYDARHPDTEALARRLAGAFEEAHWNVRLSVAPIGLRPGLFLLAADEPPAANAATVASAFDAAQINATIGTGYRAFAAERRRAQPTWRGLELAPDQSFVIAVGRSVPPP